MMIGDTQPDAEFIADGWYSYFLQQSSNNEKKAAIEVAKRILAMYSGYTREREGLVEVYGSEAFNNYLKWLKAYLTDPSLSGLSAPMPYAGGTSYSDMQAHDLSLDDVKLPVRREPSFPYVTEEDPFTLRD